LQVRRGLKAKYSNHPLWIQVQAYYCRYLVDFFTIVLAYWYDRLLSKLTDWDNHFCFEWMLLFSLVAPNLGRTKQYQQARQMSNFPDHQYCVFQNKIRRIFQRHGQHLWFFHGDIAAYFIENCLTCSQNVY
jgi:hypothetical protein